MQLYRPSSDETNRINLILSTHIKLYSPNVVSVNLSNDSCSLLIAWQEGIVAIIDILLLLQHPNHTIPSSFIPDSCLRILYLYADDGASGVICTELAQSNVMLKNVSEAVSTTSIRPRLQDACFDYFTTQSNLGNFSIKALLNPSITTLKSGTQKVVTVNIQKDRAHSCTVSLRSISPCPVQNNLKLVGRPNPCSQLLRNGNSEDYLNYQRSILPKLTFLGTSTGGVYMCQEGPNFSSTFSGPMYPAGFMLMQQIATYIETEDELDIVAPSTTRTWRNRETHIEDLKQEENVNLNKSIDVGNYHPVRRLPLYSDPTIAIEGNVGLCNCLSPLFSATKRKRLFNHLNSQKTSKYASSELVSEAVNSEAFNSESSLVDEHESGGSDSAPTRHKAFVKPFDIFFPKPKKLANGDFQKNLDIIAKVNFCPHN